METRWIYNTCETIKDLCDAANGICVIPMGCIEKHGLHLPIGADIMIASHVAYEASKLEPFAVFADFTFGDVPGKVPGKALGTVSIPVETQMLLLEQLCEGIADNGFHKILVYNGHGGNGPWLSTFVRNLKNKRRNFVFARMESDLPAPHSFAELILEKGSGAIPELTKEDEALILKYHEENIQTGHACFSETAYIMGISPEHVRFERLGIESGLNTHAGDKFRDAGIIIENGGWNVNFPNAYAGHDPIGCNERMGQAIIRIEAERVANAIRILKEDELLMEDLKKQQEAWDEK